MITMNPLQFSGAYTLQGKKDVLIDVVDTLRKKSDSLVVASPEPLGLSEPGDEDLGNGIVLGVKYPEVDIVSVYTGDDAGKFYVLNAKAEANGWPSTNKHYDPIHMENYRQFTDSFTPATLDADTVKTALASDNFDIESGQFLNQQA